MGSQLTVYSVSPLRQTSPLIRGGKPRANSSTLILEDPGRDEVAELVNHHERHEEDQEEEGCSEDGKWAVEEEIHQTATRTDASAAVRAQRSASSTASSSGL